MRIFKSDFWFEFGLFLKYDVLDYIPHKIRILKYHIRWIKRVSTLHDFAGEDIYKTIQWQLEDTQHRMLNGYADWTDSPKTLQSLRLAIHISKRLASGYHESSSFDRYYRKWKTEKEEDFMVELRREKDPEEQKDLNQYFTTSERQSQRDREILSRLIAKYVTEWLD